MMRLLSVVLLISLMAGCAKSTLEPIISNSHGIDISPFTGTNDTDQEKCKMAMDNGTNKYNNAYTRIKITSKGIYGQMVGGGAIKRTDVVTSLLSQNSCSWNMSANISIGAYKATIPLLTVSHATDDTGENWRHAVSHELLNYPFFLISGTARDSIPEIRLTLSGEKAFKSNAAALALGLAVNTLQYVSPEAKVLTTLTAQQTKDKATALDNTISRLFSSGVAEEHVSHRDLRYLRNGGGVTVNLSLPKECSWTKGLTPVGAWTIGFDDPRPSVFSNWRICEKDNAYLMCNATREGALKSAQKELQNDLGKVLNFQISSGSTAELSSIRAYLVQKQWYAAAENAFAGDMVKDQAVAEQLCKNIVNEMTGLGLNGDDAAFVVWAVIEGMPHHQSQKAKTAFAGEYCDAAYTKATGMSQRQKPR